MQRRWLVDALEYAEKEVVVTFIVRRPVFYIDTLFSTYIYVLGILQRDSFLHDGNFYDFNTAHTLIRE